MEWEKGNMFQLTIDNEQLTMKESPAGMIQEKIEKYMRLVFHTSRRDTTIVNCQLSIVNCQLSIVNCQFDNARFFQTIGYAPVIGTIVHRTL